jgi:RNA polymerase sigma factor (TIGR02999 family)
VLLRLRPALAILGLVPPDDGPAPAAELFATVYGELKRLAHGQLARGPRGTLSTTALVHEAFLKLRRSTVADREHFLALAARAMRQVLVDYARERHAAKRGGGLARVSLEGDALAIETLADEVLAVDTALGRLEAVDERLARLVEWRYFAGMTDVEIASALGVTDRTVRRDWLKARAFLYRELAGDAG